MSSPIVTIVLVIYLTSVSIASPYGVNEFSRLTVARRQVEGELSAECIAKSEPCLTAVRENTPSQQDPDFYNKMCRQYKTFYDCISTSTADCATAEMLVTIEDFRVQGLNDCPHEFSGTGR